MWKRIAVRLALDELAAWWQRRARRRARERDQVRIDVPPDPKTVADNWTKNHL